MKKVIWGIGAVSFLVGVASASYIFNNEKKHDEREKNRLRKERDDAYDEGYKDGHLDSVLEKEGVL